MSYYIHQSFLYNYLVHIFCWNNSHEDFFAKSKKPHFFVDVEIIYPEVQVSNLYSVPMVARHIHTHIHIQAKIGIQPTRWYEGYDDSWGTAVRGLR